MADHSKDFMKTVWDKFSRLNPFHHEMDVPLEQHEDPSESSNKALSAGRGALGNFEYKPQEFYADELLNATRDPNSTYAGSSASDSLKQQANKAQASYPKSNKSGGDLLTLPLMTAASLGGAALAAPLGTAGSVAGEALVDGGLGFSHGYYTAPNGEDRVKNGAREAGMAAGGSLGLNVAGQIAKKLGLMPPPQNAPAPPAGPPAGQQWIGQQNQSLAGMRARLAKSPAAQTPAGSYPGQGPGKIPHGKLTEQEIAWGAEWLKKNGIKLPDNSAERDAMLEWGHEQSQKINPEDTLPLESQPLPASPTANDNSGKPQPHDFQREAHQRDEAQASLPPGPATDAAGYTPDVTETVGHADGVILPPPSETANDIGARLRNLEPEPLPQIPEGAEAEQASRDAFDRTRPPDQQTTNRPRQRTIRAEDRRLAVNDNGHSLSADNDNRSFDFRDEPQISMRDKPPEQLAHERLSNARTDARFGLGTRDPIADARKKLSKADETHDAFWDSGSNMSFDPKDIGFDDLENMSFDDLSSLRGKLSNMNAVSSGREKALGTLRDTRSAVRSGPAKIAKETARRDSELATLIDEEGGTAVDSTNAHAAAQKSQNNARKVLSNELPNELYGPERESFRKLTNEYRGLVGDNSPQAQARRSLLEGALERLGRQFPFLAKE